jgi:peptidoglycan/xylan/chitin deacetylase (PgdA/CDA1 family)
VLADYIQEIVAKKSVYPVKRLSSMLDNKELQYTYPLKDEQILPEVLNAVHPGHLVGKDVMSELEKRYLGTDWVDRASFLPGFTREEIIRLDRRGLVQNNEGYVFLTFDDWGPDETLTKLLKVLEKHGAKATFFVRTNNIGYNPNLLRAIAMAGHTIASHTDSHFPLSHDTGNGRVFETLTDEEALDLQKDLMLSYEKLQRVVGDIEIDGKPALSLLFRPPTLAVSKIGLQTVIDCGFDYSVSGSFSTEDYKATSEQSLYWSLLRYTKS